MVIDNYEQIRNLLRFENEYDFYWINIIKRRKDNPNFNRSEKMIRYYNVYNDEDYTKVRESIVKECEQHNARAYIHLNRRNDKQIALKTLSLIAENISSENYKIDKCYNSVCGKYNKESEKKWIIDVDTEDTVLHHSLNLYLWNCVISVYTKITTVSGYHLITAPFDITLFKQQYPTIDVHKDNGTLLYFNKI